jgi:hypothetical protein
VALAEDVGDATLAAFTVTVWDVVMLDGAVYRPEVEIVPTGGLIDQVIAALPLPAAVAVNCCVAEEDRLIVVGLTDTVVV